MLFHTVAIIGTGLMGGSLGMAVRERKLAAKVLGVGRRPESLAAAVRAGAIDEFSTDLASVAEAELIVVCTPVESIPPLVTQLASHVPSGTLITDVGSTKLRLMRRIQRDALAQNRTVNFIGSHPMAGSEKTGVENARGDLFQKRAVIVTPTPESDAASVEKLDQLWRGVGASVHRMSPARHDALIAAASHVPHLVASALAASTPAAALELVAGGWLDSTRIAAGDVELWRQILTQNRRRVLKSLARFEKVLQSFRRSLEKQCDRQLVHLLAKGKSKRDAVGS